MTQRADKNTSRGIFNFLEELEKSAVGADGWSAESFRSEAEKENGYVLYIYDDDEVIALLTGYYVIGEGDITNVVVRPPWRRRGLAQRLIAEFERLLPEDAAEIFLEVRESNEAAAALYEKCGFERLAVRRNFYVNPRENAVVMRKGVA
ncbi:MAG: ribosomal protein S18-alanine N-acetyltransferase [Ruminococcus sp.]|nr:ribosomal protein S18-alanine N-acetyltransferase [Ruminococcus sp.]